MILPKKQWVTLGELTKRWGCSFGDLLQYGGEKILDIYLATRGYWVVEASFYYQPQEKRITTLRRVDYIKVRPEELMDLVFGKVDCEVNYKFAMHDLIIRPSESFSPMPKAYWFLAGKHDFLPTDSQINSKGLVIDRDFLVVSTDSIKKFESENDINSPESALKIKDHKKNNWKDFSEAELQSIKKKFPRLSKAKVANKIEARMKELGITGRGGRTPMADTIMRHGMKGWKRN